MKRTLRQKLGLTLMELLMSSVLIAIVGIGAVSVDLAVRRMRQGTSRNAIVAMRTSAIMQDIAKFGSLATGDSTDEGIRDESNIFTTLCIRWEDNTAPTPGDYTDDMVTCFSHDPNNAPFYMYRCSNDNNVWNECNAGDENLGVISGDPWAGIPIAGFQFQIPDLTAGQYYLEVTLTDCFDPNDICDTPANPLYSITSRIFPMSHSY